MEWYCRAECMFYADVILRIQQDIYHFFYLLIYPEFVLHRMYLIPHCFVWNYIWLRKIRWAHKIGYLLSISMHDLFTHTHTLLNFQLSKAKLYTKCTLKSVERFFTPRKANFKWESQIQNQELQIAKSLPTQSNATS